MSEHPIIKPRGIPRSRCLNRADGHLQTRWFDHGEIKMLVWFGTKDYKVSWL